MPNTAKPYLAHHELGLIARDQGDIEQAEATLERALALAKELDRVMVQNDLTDVSSPLAGEVS